MRYLKAPNGKPSNLTPEQWKLVRTPEFKAWFGDWENDPENASKVVDENGEPLVVHNGTNVENPFYIFDFNKADLGFHFGTYEQAKSVVNSFFLSIQNIYEVSDIGEWEYPMRYIDMLVSDGLITESDAKKNGFYRLFHREDNIQIREYLFAKYGKFIGFKYNNKYEGEGKSFIVLNPEQIKLADGSNTTFDGNNPDFRFAEGGTTNDEVDELYDIATRTFIGLGYDVTQGSNSKTDYGHSRYFYVNQDNKADVNSGLGFQVRVSDHSTGDRRILNGEQFIFDNKDVMVVFNRINYWFHPEEYNNVVAVKTKVVQIEVGENDLQPSDEIISERVAKSGNKRYTIKRTYKNEGVVPTHKFSGYKLPFKPNNPDIRFAEGGKTKKYMKRIKRGGITYGKSHAEGGIPFKNQSTGDMLEVEGGEGIVNKRSMASDKRVKLNGKDMTICEAVSQLNQMEGGVNFSCDDVEDRQFIEAMAKGGELERGTRTEQEHIQVLKDLYAKRITPKEASKRIAKDHLKEDSRYYSKLAKMEGKMANGGKIQSLSEFGNEFEKAKKELYSSNDAYQKSVEEGVAIKNDSLLSDQEKEKLLEIARKTARANKEILESARKGLTDLRTDSSPFYAPKLEWGGNLPKSVSKAIENLQVGDYKFKISHALLPQKGVDVFLKIHVPRQVVEGELKFQIGNRNLNQFNQRAVVNDVLNKYLKIDPSLWAINSIGRISKSTIVDLVLAKELIPESQNIALQISKALCNEDFYKNDILATNPTPTPPTEKKDHIDTEVEITRWSEQKVREKNDNPAMTFKVSNLVGYILLNLGNARMSDFTQLIAYAKESEMLSKEIAKLEQQGLDMNGFVIKLMADKVLNSIENLKAQIMLFTNKEEDIKEQLNTIVFFIPYLAELDTFDKDYIIHIK